ncbi:WD40 repeat domain-containing protein [Leptolyngbya sp. PCC 6406]|uniref:WD40 repeat domain-containing protein n=1 Tax=Leptolyngbya sp. PCC 6406 TaxID=1173264 RepID=UPI0002F17C87|nr:WD40 repeat domain-containing protein [Leptolyngbya sp. PCC 6406]
MSDGDIKWEPVTPFGIVFLLGAIAVLDLRQFFQTTNPARTPDPERQTEQQILPVKNQPTRRFLTGTVAVAALVTTGTLGVMTVALGQQRLVQAGTQLERAGASALRPFQSQETEPLVAAPRTTSTLDALNQKHGITALANSPATSPLLALQIALGTIRATRLEGHQGWVGQVRFSPNGQHIATLGTDGTARLWDLNGNQIALMQSEQGRFWQVLFSPNGQHIATNGGDSTVRLWDLEGNQIALMQGHQGWDSQVLFSPNGHYIATSGTDGTARLWDLAGNQIALMQSEQGSVRQVLFSPNGQHIATNGEDGTTRIWDLAGNQIALMEGHQGWILAVRFSPNGQQLATSGTDGTARLWDLVGNQIALMQGHQGSVRQVRFSPNGQQLATLGEDGTTRIWDLAGNQIALMEGHQGWVLQVLFSPNGQYIATNGEDGTTRIWDLAGNPIALLEGHQGWVGQVSFSPNSQHIATSGEDATTRIWDLNGQQIAQHEGRLGDLSPDWRWAAVVQTVLGSRDEVVKLFPVDDLEGLVARSCGRLGSFLRQSSLATDSDRALCLDAPASSTQGAEAPRAVWSAGARHADPASLS